jgi:hypothetical protein
LCRSKSSIFEFWQQNQVVNVSHLLPVAVTGDGFCEGVGDSVELENGDMGDPAIADLVEFGDVIYLRAVAIQNLEAAKAPAPGSAAAVASGG